MPEARGGSSDEAFSGMGSYLYGQRWNRPGSRIVYLSEHLSLAALEVIVHAAAYRELGSYRAFRVDYDHHLALDLPGDLPVGWGDIEPGPEAQAVGSHWAASSHSLLLRVPSAVIPAERNLLLNVEHSEYQQIAIEGPMPFRFDPRLEGFNRAS